jgi:phosphopantetheine--protein transferase-like protein
MTGPLHLGNDVVDLRDPRARGKAEDARFLQRVFTGGERETIVAAADPHHALWARWAAKEAAFKAVSKLLGSPPVFHHTRFRVSLAGEAGGDRGLRGEVRYGDLSLVVEVGSTPDFVHVLARAQAEDEGVEPVQRVVRAEDVRAGGGEGGKAGWRDALRPSFSPAEWACVTHRISALTRLGARSGLARALAVEEERLQITCLDGPPGRRIPIVLLDGAELAADLTLSHHGRFLAWAYLP